MSRIVIHAIFICGVLVVGFISGMSNMPGEWYHALSKPPFNPPDWVFAPAWSLLYVLIGWAGARTFLVRAEHPNPFSLWVVLLILNFIWMPVFFGMHLTVLAFAIILLLLLGILAFIAICRKREPVSALFFVPYAAWVAFAMLLNGAIVYLN